MVLAPFSAAEPMPRDTGYYVATARTVFSLRGTGNCLFPEEEVGGSRATLWPPPFRSAGGEFPARPRAMKESECPPVLSTTIPPSPAHYPTTTLLSRPTTS